MKQKLDNCISFINDSLSWLESNKPAEYDSCFVQLVDARSRLLTMRRALDDNPAIAAFGKSQVGKSYLINCLLRTDEEPFMVGKYNFVEQINPIGQGFEATGVVTRFSACKGQRYDEQHPIIMKTLSVADIITILADTYYNDFSDYRAPDADMLKKHLDEITGKFKGKNMKQPALLSPDQMFIMRDYFKSYINNGQVLNNVSFFDRLSLVCENLTADDIVNTFSVLWNNYGPITDVFKSLLNVLKRLNFAPTIYLDMDAVLHNGVKPDTIMSVDSLKLMFFDKQYVTKAYIPGNANTVSDAGQFSKSELCAVCAEVVIKIEDRFLNTQKKYSTQNITSANADKLAEENGSTLTFSTDKATYDFTVLGDNDLLDFPGARSRKKGLLKELTEEDTDYKTNRMIYFLRGKVAYLFNKYSEMRVINTLLYCHHDQNNDVNDLPAMLEKWVNKYVGNTIDARRETLEKSGGISPLFYVATMFNKSMKSGNETENTREAVNNRWTSRFNALIEDCFGSKDWTRNFSAEGKHFNNSYLLRDFAYSIPSQSNLYEGFKETGAETGLTADMKNKDFYGTLKSTFVNNAMVRQLFAEPDLCFDMAASINNDGAPFIINRLTRLAPKMNDIRASLFEKDMKEIAGNVAALMEGFYQPESDEKTLVTNINTAKHIQRELDFIYNDNNSFFGHMLSMLQMSRAEGYTIVHEIIQSTELINTATDVNHYELVHKRCLHFEGCDTDEAKWKRLMEQYAFETKDDAKKYLDEHNVNQSILFAGTFNRLLNSHIISGRIVDKWYERIKSVEFLNSVTGKAFNTQVMSSLIDKLKDVSMQLHVKERLADLIAEYVNINQVKSANINMVADILTNGINNMVNTFGCSMLKPDDFKTAKTNAQKYGITITIDSAEQEYPTLTEQQINEVFEYIGGSDKALPKSFEENYGLWIQYLTTALVFNLKTVIDNPEANKQLRTMLDNLLKPDMK